MAREEGGVDITSNPTVMSERIVIMRKLAEKYFGAQFSALGDDDGLNISGRYVAAHEFSHVIGLNQTTEERLPPGITGAFCEEWKASAGTYILRHWMEYEKGDEGAPTLADMQQLTQLMILNCMRYLGLRADHNAQAYMRKSIMLMKIAQEAGVITKAGDRWQFSFDEEALRCLYEKLAQQYAALLKIYHEGTMTDLGEFMEENLMPSQFVAAMAARLDEDDKVTRPSIDSLCEFKYVEATH